MNPIIHIYHGLQFHPLYWQVPLGLFMTSGAFEYLKRKAGLENKKKIAGYLTLVTTAEVLIHGIVVGLTFAGPLGYLKGYAAQVAFALGVLTLIYNFLTHGVTQFLLKAKAMADASNGIPSPVTPAQINQTSAQAATDASAGVAHF